MYVCIYYVCTHIVCFSKFFENTRIHLCKISVSFRCMQCHFKRCKTVASAFAEHLPGTRRRSWTSPWSSLCSRGNIARFRRRWYEMAETACVTEAQRLGYVEATHLFCYGPGLLVWGKQERIRRKKGLKSRFSPNTPPPNRPGCVSSRQQTATAGRHSWN